MQSKLRLVVYILCIGFCIKSFLIGSEKKTTIEVGGRKVEWSEDSSEDTEEVDFKARAMDFQRAFELMKRENPEANIYVIVGGISINFIEKFEVMPNSTLVLLKIRSKKGRMKTKIVKIEEITDLGER